jgi:hypothetical protein
MDDVRKYARELEAATKLFKAGIEDYKKRMKKFIMNLAMDFGKVSSPSGLLPARAVRRLR